MVELLRPSGVKYVGSIGLDIGLLAYDTKALTKPMLTVPKPVLTKIFYALCHHWVELC